MPCLRKAKDIVFWPGMNSEIKALVERCTVCAEFQAKNARQPMQSHQIPDRPWSKVAADLFTVSGNNYITIVDYFLDFVEASELEDTTSHAVMQVLKEQLSRHGARSIRPKFPDIPVQNLMEQTFSPFEVVYFSGNLEIPEFSCCIWHFYPV